MSRRRRSTLIGGGGISQLHAMAAASRAEATPGDAPAATLAQASAVLGGSSAPEDGQSVAALDQPLAELETTLLPNTRHAGDALLERVYVYR